VHTPTENVFSVDLEDWFHFSFGGFSKTEQEWAGMPSRVQSPTETILRLLEEANIRGTFFVLGWLAHAHPELVKKIADAGHEIGCHTWCHQPITSMNPTSFGEDLKRAKETLEDLSGKPVISFRAPMFSITPDMTWALETLVQQGFVYDSSIFPSRRLDGGSVGARTEPHRIDTPSGPLYEFPISVFEAGKVRLPLFGGGYFRLAPQQAVIAAAKSMARRGKPVMFYIHPHDLDPGQPKPVKGRLNRFRRYHGLAESSAKLRALVQSVPFRRLDEAWGHSQAAAA